MFSPINGNLIFAGDIMKENQLYMYVIEQASAGKELLLGLFQQDFPGSPQRQLPMSNWLSWVIIDIKLTAWVNGTKASKYNAEKINIYKFVTGNTNCGIFCVLLVLLLEVLIFNILTIKLSADIIKFRTPVHWFTTSRHSSF